MYLSSTSRLSRRAFVGLGSSAAVYATLPHALHNSGAEAKSLRRSTDVQRRITGVDLDAERVHALLLRAVDAAKHAGATYADARAVRVIEQTVSGRGSHVLSGDWKITRFSEELPLIDEVERHAISVRALVNGAWGFTASAWWTDDEVVALAQDAVAQARDNAQWTTTKVELAPAPVVTGTWTTPYRIDPFSIPFEEKMAFVMRAEEAYRPLYRALDHVQNAAFGKLSCRHAMHALVTSEGTRTVQHFYQTELGGRYATEERNGLDLRGEHLAWTAGVSAQQVWQDTPVAPGTGWETVADVDLWTLGEQASDSLYAASLRSGRDAMPRAAEIGQYTVVMDAATVGRLVDITIGQASDLDRILGFDANTGGTSYLGTDPNQLLGTYSFGSPLLTVTTTRAGSVGPVTGLPTVQWDDEGVAHTPFTLVKNGVLQNLPTTRDRAPKLTAYYAKQGRPIASNGCAVSGDGFGLDLTTVGAPTLVMQPNPASVSLSDLTAVVPRGLAVRGATVQADFQGRHLTIRGEMYEIVNGRLGRPVVNAVVVVDSLQLWKNLIAIGGALSAQLSRGSFTKGVPPTSLPTAVVAVPAVFGNVAVVRGR